MLTVAESNLVTGSVARPIMEKTKVVVQRPFLVAGKVQAKGAVIELPAAIANDMLGMGKATRYTELPRVEKAQPDLKESKK